jgi:hypothetical protein
MKQYNIIFKLSDTERIVLSLKESIDRIHCCYWADIFYVQNNTHYLLMHEVVRYSMDCFVGSLKKVLSNQLKLHPSIEIYGSLKKDIGYIFNEQRYGNSKNVIEELEEIEEGKKYTIWVGYKYMVWAKDVVLWMYNDDVGNIFLEITPCFPGKPTYFDVNESLTNEEKENLAKYNQWIKGYKPLLIRKVSREIAQQWLIQANKVLSIIEENVKKMRLEQKLS